MMQGLYPALGPCHKLEHGREPSSGAEAADVVGFRS